MIPIVDIHCHYLASVANSVDNYRRLVESPEIHRAVVCGFDLQLTHSEAFPLMTRYCTTNEQLADLIAKVDSPKLVPFCYVDPREKTAPKEIERWIVKEGMRGVKMAPQIGWYADDPRVLPAFQAVEALGVPVLLHMGRIASHPQLRSKFGRPIHLEDVGLACPKIKLIIGHAGCPWQWEAFRLADGFRNFFLDVTGSGSLDMQVIKLVAADKSLGVRRLVLGSDSNGSENVKRAQATLELLRQNGFTEEQLEQIAAKNALDLLGEKA